jgi:hypothetical protein
MLIIDLALIPGNSSGCRDDVTSKEQNSEFHFSSRPYDLHL